MKNAKLRYSLLVFMFFLLVTSCKEAEDPPLVELEGTEWEKYNNEAVLYFYETTWILETEGVAPDLEGTYDYSNPPRIIYYLLDEDGEVEETLEGEVVYENTITFRGEEYILATAW